MKKRILLTGGSGCVGRAILAELSSKFEFVCLALSEADCRVINLCGPAEVVLGGINDKALLESIFRSQRIDAVIHLAAVVHRPMESATVYRCVNVEATKTLATLAGDYCVEHFLFASTVAVYGQTAGNILDETAPCDPLGVYAQSKRDAELFLLNRHNLSLTILRLATVYGAGDRGNIGRLYSLVKHRLVPLLGSETTRKSLVYSGNVAAVVAAALFQKRAMGEIFNVADERDYSLSEIVKVMSSVAGVHVVGVRIPNWLLRAAGVFPVRRVRALAKVGLKAGTETQYSIAKAISVLGYKPEFDLESGLYDAQQHEVI